MTTAESMCESALPMTAYARVLCLYGIAHLIVDACCAAVVFGVASTHAMPPEVFVALLLLYHVLAFGLQTIFGLAVDATASPRLAAVVGCFVAAIALLIPMPILAVVVTAIGNALFHVGGGVISLQITPHRATAPGLFVAPGSVGLLLGAILGKSGPAASVPLVGVALVLCLLMICTSVEKIESVVRPRKLASKAEIALAFILLSITIRSLLGFLVSFPWETQAHALIALTTATCFGKALGGILADRWGWMRVAIGSMLAALPFLVYSSTLPIAAIPGLFLLNMTMPITLVATVETLPGHPGFAFGLTTLALLIGAIPFFLGVAVNGSVVVGLVVLLSLAGLSRGLQLLSISQSFQNVARA